MTQAGQQTTSTLGKISLTFGIVALLTGLVAGTMSVYLSVAAPGSSVTLLNTAAVGLSFICALVGIVCGSYGVRATGSRAIAGIGLGISIAVVTSRVWLALQGLLLSAILF